MSRPRILCVSFSPLQRDSRVRRQIAVLAEFGDVTTVGFGPGPDEAFAHVEIPEGVPSLPQTLGGVARLALHRHRAVELTAPAEREALKHLTPSQQFDLVVANDARALPLTFALRGNAPVWADMHEWAPQENSASVLWRVLVGPYMDALCRRYLRHAAAVTTVSGAIAQLYINRYGVKPEVLRNAIAFQNLKPTPVDPNHIRLVHSGVAAPERNIEGLIRAVQQLDERFSLDLYLVGDSDGYLGTLREMAKRAARVTLCDPITPSEVPGTLNGYDLGVYILPTKSLNHKLMLPNKFFEFVQARLGLVFAPSEETNQLIRQHGLGTVTAGSSAHDLVATLNSLRMDDIEGFKASAHKAARTLSNDADLATQRALVARLLDRERSERG